MSSSSFFANRQKSDTLEARPTQRVNTATIEADGDTWQETLAVCEAKKKSTTNAAGDHNNKLLIRSYFQNTRSGKRVWDEPPSGASHILPATEEMRRMANLQLQELQIVTGVVGSTDNPEEQKPKTKRGFFGFGKKKDKTNATSSSSSSSGSKIRYKKGSPMVTTTNGRLGSTSPEDADDQLQHAIARSLAESQGIPYYHEEDHGAAATASLHLNGGDDDELAMIKALSLSSTTNDTRETEEELLARVLEESKYQTKGPGGNMATSTSSTIPAGMMKKAPPQSNYNYLHEDSKMPAQSTSSQQYNAATVSPIPTSYFTAGATTTQPMAAASYSAATTTTTTTTATVAAAPPSPISPLFDPYAKDAPPVASSKPEAVVGPPPASRTTLQKMPASPSSSRSRLHFGRRGRTSGTGGGAASQKQKVKDQAGLV